jgi:chromosome partitioning protein
VTEADDVAARSRAIFKRLRAGAGGEDGPGDDGDRRDDAGPAEPGGEPGGLDGATGDGDEAGAPDAQETESEHPLGELEVGVHEHVGLAVPEVESSSAPEADPVAAASPAEGGGPGLPHGLPGAADLPTLEDLSPDMTEVAAPTQETSDEAGPQPEPEQPGSAPEGEAAPASSFARPLPRVMAVANQKGGVGKTTTAVNLGACLADLGYRVLVVDLDPQGNASTGLGINIRDLHGSMYDVILHDLPIEDCVEATSVRNLFCAPSSLDLAGAEIELVPAFSRELRLRRALDEVSDDYDFVLIDCPPSLGLLTVNGLAAATEVVVPIQCEYYALEGLGQLLRNVNLVQRNLNPRLELSAIILVMYDARTKLADQVVTEVRAHFGDKVCRNVVPRTVRLSEAPSFGQPIIAFDPTSRGAIAYRELAKEVSGGTPQRAR